MNNQLTIGQVARQVGIPAKTIRYYEDIQLLLPVRRMENKYRKYSDEDIARLRLIKQVRSLGLPLAEVKQLIRECLDGSCEHLRESFLTELPKYIGSVKSRITELQELQQHLGRLQDDLRSLRITNPQKRVSEKDCCEVLEQMELITKKGGIENVRQKKKS